VRQSTWYCGHYWPLVPAPDDNGDCWAISGIKIGRGNRNTRSKPGSNAARRGGINQVSLDMKIRTWSWMQNVVFRTLFHGIGVAGPVLRWKQFIQILEWLDKVGAPVVRATVAER
jgi:hypothetical protein